MSRMKIVETEAEIFQQWRDAGLNDAAIAKIQPLLTSRTHIQLVPTPGAGVWSRWGGLPWLEDGQLEEDDRFLCQISLDEVPPGEGRNLLPAAGFLYFFVHKRGRDKGRILHTYEAPGADDPAEYQHPNPGGERFVEGTPLTFAAKTPVICPEYESDEFDELDLPAEMGNAYMDWEESFLGDSESRFYEGCRLLGGWTDGMSRMTKTITKAQRDYLVPMLVLDPAENKAVSSSALGNIPILSQALFFFLPADVLAEKDLVEPICRYGVNR